MAWLSERLAHGAGPPGGKARVGGEAREPSIAGQLTARETEVIGLLARGMTNMTIAHALVISEGTVKYHVKNILHKLGATSRADAVAKYLRGAS